jgi:hypothetical protein
MKICDRCHRVFNVTDSSFTVTPPKKLGEIYFGSIDRDQRSFICEECKRELGILNLLGFNP